MWTPEGGVVLHLFSVEQKAVNRMDWDNSRFTITIGNRYLEAKFSHGKRKNISNWKMADVFTIVKDFKIVGKIFLSKIPFLFLC